MVKNDKDTVTKIRGSKSTDAKIKSDELTQEVALSDNLLLLRTQMISELDAKKIEKKYGWKVKVPKRLSIRNLV